MSKEAGNEDTQPEDSDEGDDEEFVVTAVRYGMTAVITILLLVALFGALQVLPETFVTPNVTINESVPSFNNTTTMSSVQIVALNATLVDVDGEATNVTLRQDGNTTTRPLLGVRHPNDTRITYPDGVSQQCITQEGIATDEYIRAQSEDSQFFVLRFTNQSGFQLFRSSDGMSFNGLLLLNGHTLPNRGLGGSLRNASIQAAENESGIWRCIPEQEEDSLLPP